MNTIDLKGKRVLFIAPKFFGYEIQIILALKKLGATVYFHSDKPSEKRWAKVLLRLFPKLVWIAANHILKKWLNEERVDDCDIVFVLKGEAVSPGLLKELRLRYPKARFVLYMYDSIANVRYTECKLALFDSVFSFDPKDCEHFSNIRYRPLFFTQEYLKKTQSPVSSGLFFFGTLNGDRPKVLVKVMQALGSRIPFDYGLYVRSNWELVFRKLIDRSFEVIEGARLYFSAVPASELQRRMSACSCVLDIEHPKQTGLTMRTFEVLAAGKKLITTNTAIRNEEFFDPAVICVIDRASPIIPLDFISGPSKSMPERFFVKNSIEGWLSEVLHGC